MKTKEPKKTVTTQQPTLFDVLPGETMSVKDVMPTLSKMWSLTGGAEDLSEDEFRASQMNIVLHMGLQTSSEEARTLFDTAIAFGKRYPCRIIVLCPMGHEMSKDLLVGKLFSECYIGSSSLRSQCCCEAIMLGYPTRVAGFLSDQVSTWLESDLPTYHWFNRIPVERITDLHMDFVKRCRRVIYNSSTEADPAAFAAINWPRPESVIDLAWARILPVRQSLGQFFSAYAPADIVHELKSVEVTSATGFSGEGANLLKWARHCLESCAGVSAESLKKARFTHHADKGKATLELQLRYRDGRHVLWTFDNETRCAQLTADLGRGRTVVPQRLELLQGEKALTEAVFFA